MENDETLEAGAAREAQEEALIDVEIGSLLVVANVTHARQVHVFFRSRMRTPAFGVTHESLEVGLVDEKDIPWGDLAFPSTEFALRRFIEDRAAGVERHHVARDAAPFLGQPFLGQNGAPENRAQVIQRNRSMAFVVTESCIKCKYTDCVEVCPVDCFHEGPNFLVIDPEECIDCTLCEPECPVEAIFSEDEVPAGQEEFKKINADLAKKWPVIAEKKAAPARCQAMGRRGGQEEAAGDLSKVSRASAAATSFPS